MAAPFFEVEDATPLSPMGVCSICLVHEDPTLAIFWSANETGGQVCPTCAGETPGEGYDKIVVYVRADRAGGLQRILGPYSAAEATRTAAYLLQLGNVQSAHVAPKPEWF